MVARRLVLLVRRLVLFVHDNQAQILDGRPDRAPGADDDTRRAGADAVPFVVAFAVRERRVEDGDAVAEARGEPLNRLRRERDLRHHDDGAAPGVEFARNRLEVDFRLAAARHAEEERGARIGEDRVARGQLFGVERQGLRGQDAAVAEGAAPLRADGDCDEPFLGEEANRGGRRLQLAAELRHPPAAEALDVRIELTLTRRCAHVSCLMSRALLVNRLYEQQFPRPCVLLQDGRREGGSKYRLQGCGGVGRDLLDERQEIRREERRLVEDRRNRLQPVGLLT